MFEITVCVTAHCDVCGTPHSHNHLGGLPEPAHLDATEPGQDITDALTAAGWRIELEDWLVCLDCASRADCLTHGHTMPRHWSNCLCRGAFRNHHTGPDGRCAHQTRRCTRCTHASETRPAQAA